MGLREEGFSNRAIGACVQLYSSSVMRVGKRWTDEHRTTGKTSRGRQKVTSACDDGHQLRIALNDSTDSSRQMAALLSPATGVLMSSSSTRRRLLHRRLHATVPLHRIPLMENNRRVRL
ncbi:transposable element Tcb2 transposase [Trichonephila clavipes]|nr:transposable element Tcb2 transposase [Trichonephila clavipes]